MRALKPEMKAFIDQLNNEVTPQLLAAGYKKTPINNRESLANTTKTLTTEVVEVAKILDDIIDGGAQYSVPVRIFNPNPDKALPVMIYFHGGGGSAGSVSVYDPLYRRLAVKTNHIVIAPEYRLAPENPYPAAEIDSRTVYYGVFDLLDRLEIKHEKRLSIGGDSGGGALSTALARDVQHDKSVPLDAMFLIYPSVDYTMSFDSYKEDVNGKGYILETPGVKWYFDMYFSHGENRHLASPIFAEISEDLPRTLIFTAEFCPLRDEGIAYGDKLKEAGVEVELHNIENMPHVFMNMENLAKEETEFVYGKINEFLNK